MTNAPASTRPRAKAKANAPAPEPAPKDVLREALELAARQREEDAARAASRAAGRWREYLELLDRAGEPRKDDAARLSRLMIELEVTSEQVEQDLALLEKYRSLRSQHEALDTLRARESEARQAFHDLERQQRAALAEAGRALDMASNEARTASAALFEGCRLHLQRPEFFEGEPVPLNRTGNAAFPQLLSSTPTP